MDAAIERAKKIAVLNDEFRKRQCGPERDQIGLDVVVTSGLCDFLVTTPGTFKFFSLISAYNSFDRDNDPYGEHDFGSLEWHGETVFWKIDYYDKSLHYGEDPLDLNCQRVLTITLANEY
jgi:hypothetical protein